MQCPSCAAEVSEGSRFCNRCGTALARALPRMRPQQCCRFQVLRELRRATDQRWLDGGRCVRPAPPAPLDAAERRQVTVMFCDLVGSTALSAGLDPEDLRAVIAAYYREVAVEVQRFGGFVARHIGDGVLIYFGYPAAHEDDSERAVRAGLALISAIRRLKLRPGIVLDARVGIATGLVVVDMIGEGPAREWTVLGRCTEPGRAAAGLCRTRHRPHCADDPSSDRRRVRVPRAWRPRDQGPRQPARRSGRCCDRAMSRTVSRRDVRRTRRSSGVPRK